MAGALDEIKALTRHVGLLKKDEYTTLRPIADLIRFIQTQASIFLSEPLEWEPSTPPEDKGAEKIQALDNIKKRYFRRASMICPTDASLTSGSAGG